MSTAPVRRLCPITSSFWNRIQVIFSAAGLVPHQPSLRAISIDWPCFQSTNLYGPVPIGWEFGSFWMSDADMPCQMCCGRIGTASPGLNACGAENVSTSVVSSGASADVRSATHWAYWLTCFDRIRSKVNLASAAVNGLPSCQVAERSLYVMDLPSALYCQEVARPGSGCSFRSYCMSWS